MILIDSGQDFPDLIVFNKNDFFFAEVKSKNDKLSRNQIDNHYYLLNKVKVNVTVFSINKTEKQVQNLKYGYMEIFKLYE